MSAVAWCGVGLFGALGAVARVAVDARVQARAPGQFPYGTLSVNLSGALALGVLVGAGVGGEALLLAGTGFLASYTTFSTWMLETLHLAEDGRRRTALAYLGVSAAGGIALAALGWWLGGF